MENLDRFVKDLTAGELIELLKIAIPSMKRQRIDGLRGLAAYLGVALPTAQRLKTNQTVIAYEAGKRVYFYSDEVDDCLRVKPIKRKR